MDQKWHPGNKSVSHRMYSTRQIPMLISKFNHVSWHEGLLCVAAKTEVASTLAALFKIIKLSYLTENYDYIYIFLSAASKDFCLHHVSKEVRLVSKSVLDKLCEWNSWSPHLVPSTFYSSNIWIPFSSHQWNSGSCWLSNLVSLTSPITHTFSTELYIKTEIRRESYILIFD